jgi:hypothetical protein
MHGEVTNLCNIILYTFEKIAIFEVILNENERREKRRKLVSVEKGKLLYKSEGSRNIQQPRTATSQTVCCIALYRGFANSVCKILA